MNHLHSLHQELKRHLPWHQARLRLVAPVVVALIQVRSVNLTNLASAFTGRAQGASVYNWLNGVFQQFLNLPVVKSRWTSYRSSGSKSRTAMHPCNRQFLALVSYHNGLQFALNASVNLGKSGPLDNHATWTGDALW